MIKPTTRTKPVRRGAALVELAIMLPIFLIILVGGLDFGRVFYHAQIITNCARTGALYESDPYSPLRNTYGDYKKAALADAKDLSPALTEAQVTSAAVVDVTYGNAVAVTVEYDVATLSSYLIKSGSVHLKKTVTMRVSQVVPDP